MKKSWFIINGIIASAPKADAAEYIRVTRERWHDAGKEVEIAGPFDRRRDAVEFLRGSKK